MGDTVQVREAHHILDTKRVNRLCSSMVERATHNRLVIGSIPITATIIVTCTFIMKISFSLFINKFLTCNQYLCILYNILKAKVYCLDSSVVELTTDNRAVASSNLAQGTN